MNYTLCGFCPINCHILNSYYYFKSLLTYKDAPDAPPPLYCHLRICNVSECVLEEERKKID